MPRMKTVIGPRNDTEGLQIGTLDELTSLVASFRNPATIADASGTTLKDFLLPRYDLNAVPLLLSLGVTFEDLDLFNLSNLYGHVKDEQVLVDKMNDLQSLGLNLSVRSPTGDTLFHAYARCFSSSLFEHLVQAGVDPTLKNEQGETALHALVPHINDDSTDFFTTMFAAGVDGEDDDPGLQAASRSLMASLSADMTQSKVLHTTMLQWVQRFMDAGCSPSDEDLQGRSVFDRVRTSQHRWEAAVAKAIPNASPAHAFMTVLNGLDRRRPEGYTPANLALIESMETLAGVIWLDRSPLALNLDL